MLWMDRCWWWCRWRRRMGSIQQLVVVVLVVFTLHQDPRCRTNTKWLEVSTSLVKDGAGGGGGRHTLVMAGGETGTLTPGFQMDHIHGDFGFHKIPLVVVEEVVECQHL